MRIGDHTRSVAFDAKAAEIWSVFFSPMTKGQALK